ncbi:hypothetical protein LEMLEM_LOCUS6401, partial [Lemmus lemmus]
SRGASSRPLLSPPAASAPRCSRGREGGGRERRRRWWCWLLSRWQWRPDGAGAATAADAVQRNESILREPSCQPTQLLKSPESTATFSHPRTESVIPELLVAHKVSLKQS